MPGTSGRHSSSSSPDDAEAEIWFGQINTSIVGRNHYAKHQLVESEVVSLVLRHGLEVHNGHSQQVGSIPGELRPKLESLTHVGTRVEGVVLKGGSKYQVPVSFQIYATPGEQDVDLAGIQNIIAEIRQMPKPVVWPPSDRRVPAGATANGRTYLNCPFAQKDEAKRHGAKFDWDEKKWYVPEGLDTSRFQRWLPKQNIVPSSQYVYAELHVVQAPKGGIRVIDLDVERWQQLPGAARASSQPAFAEKTSRMVRVQDWRHEFKQFSSGRVAYDAMPCATDPGIEPALMEHQLKALWWLQQANRLRTVADPPLEGPMSCFWKQLPKNSGYRHALTGAVVTDPPELPRGGLFADDMGLGKTWAMVALLRTAEQGRSLIICPSSALAVWQEPLRAAHLAANVYHVGMSLAATATNLIVLATYDSLTRNFKQCASDGLFATELCWRRVILDEAHCIRNRGTMRSKAACALEADARFCLTGTPVVNGIGDLFPLVRFLRIKPIHEYPAWRQLFVRKHPKALERTNLLLRAFVLRRTKDMGFLTLPNRHVEVLKVEFSSEEKAMHDLLFEQVAKRATANHQPSTMLAHVLRLRQLCTDYGMLPCEWVTALRSGSTVEVDHVLDTLGEDRITRLRELIANQIDDDCAICLDKLSERPTKVCATICGHLFHRPCLLEALSEYHICPQCRGPLHGSEDLVSPEAVQQWQPAADRDAVMSSKLQEAHRLIMERWGQDERRKAKKKKKPKHHKEVEATVTRKRKRADTGEAWRNVSDKKVAILTGPDVASPGSGEYIGRGEVFYVNVSDVRVAGTGPSDHVYLRLVDGRGWLSSRSRKDLHKVVATRVGEEPEGWDREMQEDETERNDSNGRTGSGAGIVVFSQFLRPLEVLASSLGKAGIAVATLHGGDSQEQRVTKVQQFQAGELKVLLCSSGAACVGISLTAADTAIILDPGWNAALEAQAIDRIHRLGQTHEVHVVRLVAKDSFEERLLLLQQEKEVEATGALATGDEAALQQLRLASALSIFGVVTARKKTG